MKHESTRAVCIFLAVYEIFSYLRTNTYIMVPMSKIILESFCILFWPQHPKYITETKAQFTPNACVCINMYIFAMVPSPKFMCATSRYHYGDVIMGAIASQITSITIVYSTVYSDADQRNIKAPRHWPLWGEFPAQMASNAENVSIWWRHHDSFAIRQLSPSH